MDTKKKEKNIELEVKLLDKHLPTLLRDIETDKQVEYLNDEVVNDLASRFGLNLDTLRREMRTIRASVIMHTDIQGFYAPAKTRDRCLDGVKKSAFTLADRMMEMPVNTRHEIQKELTNEPELMQAVEHHYPPEWIGDDDYSTFIGGEIYDSIFDSLLKFANAVQRVKVQDTSAAKNKPSNPKDVLINATARTWKRLSGRDATYTTNWASSKRGGDFISFLVSVAEIIGIDPKSLPERFRRLKEKGDI